MINFFLLSLPIFAVIGVGWAATRTRLVAPGALDALKAFSFRFALPALLLRLIAGQPLRQSFNPEFYTGYLASGATIFVSVLGTSRIVAARGLSTAGAHATTATSRGMVIMRLETNRSLSEAKHLYERTGFVAVEPFNNEPYAHHWFQKDLRHK
jgi:hypothetical protein